MNAQEVIEKLEKLSPRSAWSKGVRQYAVELVGEVTDADAFSNPTMLKNALLNGASDWQQYSEDGSALIYNSDIAERLCSPSELKRNRDGERDPNSCENWFQCQARALFQAWRLVKRVAFGE